MEDLGDVDPLRALHSLVGLESPRYDRADVERLARASHEDSVRWWRAMGFPEIPEGVVAFGDPDVAMVRRLSALVGAGLVSDVEIMRLARLLGAAFSRIAEAQIAALDEMLLALPDADPDASTGDRLRDLVQTSDEDGNPPLLGVLEDSLVYVWRRHLLAAIGRWVGSEEEAALQAVGFADITGFTQLAKRLEPEALAALVDSFETMAFDVVPARGGRVVKLIGDEVMFVADTAGTAVDIALDLVARAAEGPPTIPVHCGIAYGPTVTVGGDVFGPTVNLASRLTAVARTTKVVLPRELATTLEERDDLVVKPVRRTYDLKGIGRTRLVTVSRVDEP